MVLPARVHAGSFPVLLRRATSPLLALLLACGVASASCSTVAPPTRVLVTRTPAGDRAMHEEGANVKIRKWDLEVARKGLERGFFVVKNELEWRTLWPTLDADRIPLLPNDLDFSREMLLVSSPTEQRALASEIKTAIETEQNGVHVYVVQQLPGMGCPAKEGDGAPYDLARIRRIDGKDVRFHVDTVHADPCGAPPETKITCRPNGTTGAFQEKLAVAPGTGVACIAAGTSTSRPIFDRTWTFGKLPAGSTAKMTMAQGGLGVSFIPDLFGPYELVLEITDDLQRRGTTSAVIDVVPPPDALVLQMGWTKFDPSDDPSTFPRVELHVLGVTPAETAKKVTVIARPGPPNVKWGAVKDCTAEGEKPPAWCNVKATLGTTIMTLDRTSAKLFAMAVHYTDERVAGQPVLCVRAFRGGKLQTELCDPAPRKEGAWWEAGAVDGETGKTPEALAMDAAKVAEQAAKAAAEVAAAAAAAHAASAKLDSDGGAPDAGGSHADAGADAGKPAGDAGKAAKP